MWSGRHSNYLLWLSRPSVASNKKEQYRSLYGDNALFSGTEAQLAAFVTDDIVIMKVTSLGSHSYDTQIGGNTTAPLFQVDSIGRKGSCAD